jgi:putative membrane protein
MITNHEMDKKQWFRFLLNWKSSVLPAIMPRVLFSGLFSVLIVILYFQGINLALPLESGIVPSVVLGLLLVFRTNTAYDRFWEGRKLWGTIINTTRNLARMIWVSVKETEASETEAKIIYLRLLVSFSVATKLHLRFLPINQELAHLMPSSYFQKLQSMNNPPLEIVFWISDYLQQQYDQKRINVHQLMALFQLLDKLVDCLGSCERILKTPIPLAYKIHLKQLLLIYCWTLPFQLIDELGYWTPFFVILISFTVFGIEAIGIEIENPFGTDPNDLPLDQICKVMETNIEDLITLTPHVRHYHNPSNSTPKHNSEML